MGFRKGDHGRKIRTSTTRRLSAKDTAIESTRWGAAIGGLIGARVHTVDTTTIVGAKEIIALRVDRRRLRRSAGRAGASPAFVNIEPES